MNPADRIFVAIDTADEKLALDLAGRLKGLTGGFKLGKEFFTARGPAGVAKMTAAGSVAGSATGAKVFLDLKFHDIPATVKGAVSAALPLKPFMLNVHAAGGQKMMRAAAEAAREAGVGRPLVLAVTVLTSLADEDLATIGVSGPVDKQVLRLAGLAKNSGLDGVVCSAREARALRTALGPDFKLVVPGIRPAWAAADDQKRVTTPRDALASGADYLVIGRPITAAADPAEAAKRIVDEIS